MERDPFPVAGSILREAGFSDFVWVQPSSMTVSQWVRMKCMFGCPDYGKNASCPPHVPSVGECRELLSEYSSGVLVHLACDVTPDERDKWCRKNQELLVEAERQIFLAGYERAFLLSFDNCNICGECVPLPSECRMPYKRRPTMEAFAIDVYSSVRRHGYSISVRKDRSEKPDRFALMLVE